MLVHSNARKRFLLVLRGCVGHFESCGLFHNIGTTVQIIPIEVVMNKLLFEETRKLEKAMYDNGT